MELALDMAAPDKIGRGIIRRVSLPNHGGRLWPVCAGVVDSAGILQAVVRRAHVEDGFDAFSPVRRLGLASSRSIFGQARRSGMFSRTSFVI